MELLEGIFTRKSIRRYTGESLSEDQLKLILRAGFAAPSAHNKQPWHFVVVRDKSILEQIAKVHPYAKMLPQAGCGIIVCGDSDKEKKAGFLTEDCSAAIQNMLLAAHGIGLGAVWCGLYPVPALTKAVTELLDFPENILPIGLVVTGHKNEERKAVDLYDEQKVHYDKW
ncbi:MAG: nitroreductase family protein [Ruminiclostridium sp.]|nr:nitroreductase family protein [Ruminiclostridium sp.]